MLRTTYLNLKKPEGSDPINVQDFNDNADTIDTEVNARVKSSGGDIANTKVSAFTASTASYPVPAAGETPKVFMGKIKKFFEDFKSFKDSIVTKTMIINQILNDSTKAASAATVYSVNEKVDSAISDLTSVTAQLTGTPVLLGPGSILENIKWYIKNHLHVRGSFPYEPDHNNNNRVSDLPAGAEAWGRVEWFKLASDEYRVILYTENNVKTYHRLIVSGSWSGDWEEK